MNIIPQVNNTNKIISAEFVKLLAKRSDGAYEKYTFSSSYKTETIDGDDFLPLSGLLSISNIQRDLKASSFDTSIALTVNQDREAIYIFLTDQYQIKGSSVEIYRGFYNESYELQDPVVKRYTGIVTSYTIQETVDPNNNTDIFTVSFNCSNFRNVLENRVSGRHTNPTSWALYSADPSMENVPNLMNAYFNFGKKV